MSTRQVSEKCNLPLRQLRALDTRKRRPIHDDITVLVVEFMSPSELNATPPLTPASQPSQPVLFLSSNTQDSAIMPPVVPSSVPDEGAHPYGVPPARYRQPDVDSDADTDTDVDTDIDSLSGSDNGDASTASGGRSPPLTSSAPVLRRSRQSEAARRRARLRRTREVLPLSAPADVAGGATGDAASRSPSPVLHVPTLRRSTAMDLPSLKRSSTVPYAVKPPRVSRTTGA